jgi:hypothetical protein
MEPIGTRVLPTAKRYQIADKSTARRACGAREQVTIGSDEARLRLTYSPWRRFDPAEHDTTFSNRSLLNSHRERESCDGKVAMAPRHFVEHADPGMHPKRDLDPRDDFIFVEPRRVETRKKFVCRNVALAPDRFRDDIGAEAHRTSRQLRRRIGKRKAAAESSAVADRRMGNVL